MSIGALLINPENVSGLVVVTHIAGQGQIVRIVRSAQRFWNDVV